VFESHKNDIEQATITYLFSFNDVPKELELPIKILNHKLGESSNSILFRELREKRGFAYDVYTHLDLSSNVKTLHIFTSLVEENVEEAINVINECIEKIKSKDIVFDESTFDLMKKVHKTAVVSTLEDSTDLGNYVLHQILEGESMFEFIKDMHNLDSLKPEDIYTAAEYILREPTVHILRS
jgi:predicted Zn-dependent peptidase